MNILLIEPDAVLGGLYQKALNRLGYSVRHVQGGQSAIESCDQKAPELIILEVHLRGHNGIGFLHELRSYPEWQHIPVLLHTFTPISRISALVRKEFGIVDHLYKPATSIHDFVHKVQLHSGATV